MNGLQVLMLVAGGWLVTVLAARAFLLPWLRHGPKQAARVGLIWRLTRLFCRVRHHPRWEGLEDLRDQVRSGPLVLVANHTGAIDPFIIQSGCRFDVRWMMAVEQMYPALDWLWKLLEIIPVARDGKDMAAARAAIRQVRDGGAVGIFPEGRIVTPPGRVWPFLAGVGLIVARAKAPVMLVWISETPHTSELAPSLLGPSHTRVRYFGPIEYPDGTDPETIADDLRRRIHEISGWPLVDEPPERVMPEAGLELG